MQFCSYCGEPADTYDHVIPLCCTTTKKPKGVSRHNKEFGDTILCCRECNSLLGSKLFPSIQARALYLATTIEKRYKKLLLSPVWDADELAEVGPGLRASILADAERKMVIRRRIKFARGT